jgi:hypothetical protein
MNVSRRRLYTALESLLAIHIDDLFVKFGAIPIHRIDVRQGRSLATEAVAGDGMHILIISKC